MKITIFTNRIVTTETTVEVEQVVGSALLAMDGKLYSHISPEVRTLQNVMSPEYSIQSSSLLCVNTVEQK
jgi:hypothetical protein